MQPSSSSNGPMDGQQQQGTDQADEVVQVVYESNQSGSLVGVESSLIAGGVQQQSGVPYEAANNQYASYNSVPMDSGPNQLPPDAGSDHEQQEQQQILHQPLGLRASSTLPSVAEESSSGAAGPTNNNNQNMEDTFLGVADDGTQRNLQLQDERTSRSISRANEEFACDDDHDRGPAADSTSGQQDPCCANPNCAADLNLIALGELRTDFCMNPNAIYSTINKQQQQQQPVNGDQYITESQPVYSYDADTADQQQQQPVDYDENDENRQPDYSTFADYNDQQQQQQQQEGRKDIEQINAEICQIISRQKQGAAESGSLKNNFKKKKLVVSASTNENDLIAHRQKLLSSQDHNAAAGNIATQEGDGEETLGDLPSKFKRTHSVSFNVNSGRNSRHSVDIRNLPSYLTVKRASIVDVARGAMSSLMHSFGSGTATASSISKDSRRESSSALDEEPIFEEPIAPTLSLGQRVALVKNNGAEFGTVGWIGQLADVDDDWVVGVVFDNMIGNCDGAYNGVRYFYARENFAMFVPLSVLTKTDNYIGRPETGTMLSRMSVSLKPGQLISIQRSSIRLQHCFLNAPHQRVGHDVRAVSNRLHCQCHNCGPCAHLTKQHSRANALPAFGAHHAVNKKNSLAHAAVEILAHHHHHYHEEEHHEEEDYQFGDNAAHACNFVRYSCCQQNGGAGHEFSSDCGLVRPELLDNLIHAPRAPHRRSARPRRIRRVQADEKAAICAPPAAGPNQQAPAATAAAVSTLDSSSTTKLIDQIDEKAAADASNQSRSASCSSCSSSRSSSPSGPNQNANDDHQQKHHATGQTTNSYQLESMNYFQGSATYNTLDSKMSLHDQQRFIYQRESSTLSARRRLHDQDYDDDDEPNEGLLTRVRRCFGCLRDRDERTTRRRRPKKRKLSARNRLIEYRRKQSTFVPSTLAKPQEDFASHGILLPGWDSNNAGQEAYNSDYSSYSRSSRSDHEASPSRVPNPDQQQQQFISIDHDVQLTAGGDQLKSCNTIEQRQLNYDDYTFDNDGYGQSYGKFAQSQESDLGYYGDLMTNSSGGTLKNIVDSAIEREESLQQMPQIDTATISPIQSTIDSASHSCCDQQLIEVSSPTVSMVDQELSEGLAALNMEDKSADS